MTALPADICRCHDNGCPERHDCRRYLDRLSGTNHCGSLKPYDKPLGDPCENRLDRIQPRTPS